MPTTGTKEPKKLTPELIEEIEKAVAAGVPPQAAARAIGVRPRTWSEWIRLGKADNARGLRLALVEAVERGEARAVQSAIARLQTFANGGAVTKRLERTTTRRDGTVIREVEETRAGPDWRGMAWVLERRWPEEFRKVAEVLGGEERKPVDADSLRGKLVNMAEARQARRAARAVAEAAESNGHAGR